MVYVYTLLFTCGLISLSMASNALQVLGSAKGPRAMPEDALLDIRQLGYKNGYHVDDHSVITKDGYILHMHRMPESISGHKNGQVVFLMHGILDCSDSWILLGPEHALAYQLVEEGFDVWMGNARGNKHSSRHVSLHSNAPDFWKFSWEEIGVYDLPAMIDYVLNVTQERSLHYIGHSQGTTVGYVMLSMKPEYNKKIKMMFSLAPEAWMGSIQSPIIRMFSPALNFLQSTLLQFSQFSSAMDFYNKITPMVCGLLPDNCQNIMFAMTGNENKINSSLVPVILGHMPTGSSALQFIHYGQLVNSKRFCRYDFGHDTNVKMYGRVTPPDFDLSKITTPILILYSNNDWLSHPHDVNMLNRRLPKVVDKINIGEFTHLDYVYSTLARDAIYKPIIESMIDYEKYHNKNQIPDCSSLDQANNNFNGGSGINLAPGCFNNQQPDNNLTNVVQAPEWPNPAQSNNKFDQDGGNKHTQQWSNPKHLKDKFKQGGGNKHGSQWPNPKPPNKKLSQDGVNKHGSQWPYPKQLNDKFKHIGGSKHRPQLPNPKPPNNKFNQGGSNKHGSQWLYPKQPNDKFNQGGVNKYPPQWPNPNQLQWQNPKGLNKKYEQDDLSHHPPQWKYPQHPNNHDHGGGKHNAPHRPVPKYPSNKFDQGDGGDYSPHWKTPKHQNNNQNDQHPHYPPQWQYPNHPPKYEEGFVKYDLLKSKYPNPPSNNTSKWEHYQDGKHYDLKWQTPYHKNINHEQEGTENHPSPWKHPDHPIINFEQQHPENTTHNNLESREISQDTEHLTIEYNTENTEYSIPETLLPEYIELYPEHIELPSEHIELPPEHIELPPEHIELPPEHIELPSEHIELPPEYIELPPEYIELPPEHIELLPEHIDDLEGHDDINKEYETDNPQHSDLEHDKHNFKYNEYDLLDQEDGRTQDNTKKNTNKRLKKKIYKIVYVTDGEYSEEQPVDPDADKLEDGEPNQFNVPHKPRTLDIANDGMKMFIDQSNSIDRNAETYNHINNNPGDKGANLIQESPTPFMIDPVNSLEKIDDPRSHIKNFDDHFYQERSNPFHVEPHNLFEYRTTVDHHNHGCKINGYDDCVEEQT